MSAVHPNQNKNNKRLWRSLIQITQGKRKFQGIKHQPQENLLNSTRSPILLFS